jgi:hypothetical protein
MVAHAKNAFFSSLRRFRWAPTCIKDVSRSSVGAADGLGEGEALAINGDVAAALGISRSLYAAVEQGKRAASVPETAALAAALHTSVDQVRRVLPPSPA